MLQDNWTRANVSFPLDQPIFRFGIRHLDTANLYCQLGMWVFGVQLCHLGRNVITIIIILLLKNSTKYNSLPERRT